MPLTLQARLLPLPVQQVLAEKFAGMVTRIFSIVLRILFSADLKPRGYYLELFWQADLGYIGRVIIGVKVPNSSHVASIRH